MLDNTDEADSDRAHIKHVKKDQTKEIKRFAVSEMQPQFKLLNRKRGRDVKIETTDAEKLAVKLPEIAA